MASGPLSGVRVIELAGWHTGPAAATILGDLGADVIKIEAPRGDDYRQGGTSRQGYAMGFIAANRNKRSVVLDVKQEAHRAALKQMVGQADVFIQNLRPGAVDRLGLGAEQLRAAFPRLIHVSISGYGQTGPKSGERAFDTMIQGMSGLAMLQKDPTGRPLAMATLVVDKMTSPMVAQAICAALYQRERTGEGSVVDYNMLDAALWWVWPDMMANYSFIGDGVRPGPEMVDADFVCPTSDGFVILSPHLDTAWHNFTELVGRPELRADPRFATAGDRMRNLRDFSATVRSCLHGRTTAEWCELLPKADVPCAPVYRPEQIFDDPQVQWNGVIEEVDHPVAGKYRIAKSPILHDGKRNGTWRHVPAVGEHTNEVLKEFGIKLDARQQEERV